MYSIILIFKYSNFKTTADAIYHHFINNTIIYTQGTMKLTRVIYRKQTFFCAFYLHHKIILTYIIL